MPSSKPRPTFKPEQQLKLAYLIPDIYRLVDMGNTTVNIMGDMVGTAIVSRSESA